MQIRLFSHDIQVSRTVTEIQRKRGIASRVGNIENTSDFPHVHSTMKVSGTNCGVEAAHFSF